jgi:hypothetical protein
MMRTEIDLSTDLAALTVGSQISTDKIEERICIDFYIHLC